MKIQRIDEIKGQIHLTLDDNFCILLPNQGSYNATVRDALVDVLKRQVTFEDIQISRKKLSLIGTSYGRDLFILLTPSKGGLAEERHRLEKIIHLPPPYQFPKDEL
jgi:hypothetical protein